MRDTKESQNVSPECIRHPGKQIKSVIIDVKAVLKIWISFVWLCKGPVVGFFP